MFFWLELESNATFRFGRVQRNKTGQLYYGHDISLLYFLDSYICLKDSSSLASNIYFKILYFTFILVLYQWEVTELEFYSQYFNEFSC